MGLLEKSLKVYREQGLTTVVKKAVARIGNTKERQYKNYRKHTCPGKKALAAQKEKRFFYEPLISIVVPVYETKPFVLQQMLNSVISQTYENWELVLSDASKDGSREKLALFLFEKNEKVKHRLSYLHLSENKGISENTNKAIFAARGEWIVFLDHDDLLTPDALYELVKHINKTPKAEIWYSDEDKCDYSGKRFFDPHLKPGFNLDLLLSGNYICHMVAAKTSLVESLSGLRPEYDGAQDFDFLLRAAKALCAVDPSGRIRHIPKVLYHWRMSRQSTAADPAHKAYIFEAGKRAIEAYTGHEARVCTYENLHYYQALFPLPEDKSISVIIPNKDHYEDLRACLVSLSASTLLVTEILVVENNSEDPETFTRYEELKREFPAMKLLSFKGPFNFAAINNFAAKKAQGTWLLLMNNDVTLLEPSSIKTMLSHAARPEVGVVGARLLYPDQTVQHAGVVMAFPTGAGHIDYRIPASDYGYMGRMRMHVDYSAVTAACMMVKKEAYLALGGMEEKLAVAYNDVDFCLRMRETGKLVVYLGEAVFIHAESKSRGLEDETPEKQARYKKETEYLLTKFQRYMKKGDPYYHPGLSHLWQDCRLKTEEEWKKKQQEG